MYEMLATASSPKAMGGEREGKHGVNGWVRKESRACLAVGLSYSREVKLLLSLSQGLLLCLLLAARRGLT